MFYRHHNNISRLHNVDVEHCSSKSIMRYTYSNAMRASQYSHPTHIQTLYKTIFLIRVVRVSYHFAHVRPPRFARKCRDICNFIEQKRALG